MVTHDRKLIKSEAKLFDAVHDIETHYTQWLRFDLPLRLKW